MKRKTSASVMSVLGGMGHNKLCEQRLTDDNEGAACGPSARHEG